MGNWAVLLTMLGLTIIFAGPILGEELEEKRILYRIVEKTPAYKKSSQKPHININITPPRQYGSEAAFVVEVFNETLEDIEKIDFGVIFKNNSWSHLESNVSVSQLGPKKTATYRILAPKGKGAFPVISQIEVTNLKIYNKEIKELKVFTFVNLIRPKQSRPASKKEKK